MHKTQKAVTFNLYLWICLNKQGVAKLEEPVKLFYLCMYSGTHIKVMVSG